MSEADAGTAWIEAPAAYAARRPPAFDCPDKPLSLHVPMPDGCRLAVDVHLPQKLDGGEAPPERLPTIVLFTCYYRRFRLKPGFPDVEANPNTGRYRNYFVPRGYAVVVVDVRGTGASFGTRDGFRSPRERQDSASIADWIVAQNWSDGTIGSTGVSYVGAAASFLASTGHPAVKAIAPLFAVWDTFGDHFYPGGAPTRLAETNNEMSKGLDNDRRDLLTRYAYFSNPAYDGPQPVDGDEDGAMLRAAQREHADSFTMSDFMAEFRFRDDALPYDPDFTSAAISPYGYAEGFRDDVAIYSVSGWYDGAGFSNSAILRFLSLPTTKRHLLLGPWDHGARINVSPWRDSVEVRFDLLAELLRFFDHYVRALPTGLEREAPVHFYGLREEAWHAEASWPPATRPLDLSAGGDVTLDDVTGAPCDVQYRVSFGTGSGRNTRFERLLALDCRDYYSDWDGRDAAMLAFTSAPLEADLDLAGHPILSLSLTSSEPDVILHAYLSEVDASGKAIYVTEGVLRGICRAEAEAPPNYRAAWPYHTLTRADAKPLVPGERVELRLPLLPIAWRFAAGSRIRLSIAGADCDHFVALPHGRPPLLTIRAGAGGSVLTLPVR